MSRSALFNQTGRNVQRANEQKMLVATTRATALQQATSATIVTVGNQETYNLNPMLFNNIMIENYFLKLCEKVPDMKALVDEIYYKVTDAGPWQTGTTRVPSNCFSCLVRLCLMTSTKVEIMAMLRHIDSPYIRCVGFLYVRYCVEPKEVWGYVAPSGRASEAF